MNKKIPAASPYIDEADIKIIYDIIKSGWISSKGEYVKTFERNFSKYIGTKYACAVSNGTVALHLALKALKIGHGDEVLVPDLTFVSPASMVILSGAAPIFVDVNPKYWCIDPEDIRKKITSRTKAIIPVHLYGHPCDMKPIIDIAKEYNLSIIEDCAEAHGAEYYDKKVGTFGDISCFSFYGNKIITTGEGGMCLTNNEEILENLYLYRDHGMKDSRRYWHEVVGYNYRMTNLQAGLGVSQLEKIEDFIKRKIEIAKLYSKFLEDIDCIKLHPEMVWAKNVYWFYSILLNNKKVRNKLHDYLMKNNIEVRKFFYPIHIMPPYKKYVSFGCKNSVLLSNTGINLPSSCILEDEEILYISEQIREFLL